MYFNWRRLLIYSVLKARGSPITEELKFLRSIEWKSPLQIREIQDRRLTELLLHAWQNTEYYREVLSERGVVVMGRVNLERFEDIPILTKDIIRREGSRLRASVLPRGRKPYFNSTGGSTGQPLEFWQDSLYNAVNIATKLYHFEMLGKQLGEPEMKIWGSERDLFEGTIGITAKMQNFLYNRTFQQCFHLPEERLRSIIRGINKVKPKIIWCYRDGIYTVAEFASRNGLGLHRPAAIFIAGGTLYPFIEETVEKAFDCPVINFYGSREMGDLACQCKEKVGLHISSHSHKIETVSRDGSPVMEEDGELVVTSLINYAMPFIRYRIGDHGELTIERCPCGRGFPILKSVTGRVIERLINARGDYISPIYFIHLMGVVYNRGFIERFQVVQDDYQHLTVKIILRPGTSGDETKPYLEEITDKIKLVMGNGCAVDYIFVDDIPLTKSGKHLYVLSNIAKEHQHTSPPMKKSAKPTELSV